MALQPPRGLASSLGEMGTWTSTTGTNGPLSSITQKSGSRCKIVLPVTGEPVCSSAMGRCATTEEPGTASQDGLTSGRGNLFSFCSLEPSFKAAVQASCQAHPYARSPLHISHHCTQSLLHKGTPPPRPRAQETPNKNNNDKTIIIALCRNGTFTHDFI